MEIIKGKVIVLGDSVDTDQILPGYAMSESEEELGKYALAGLPGKNPMNEAEPGYILVAGRNFGCGSSREQAPIALKQAGVALIIAASFARIFRRNAINIGLPVLAEDMSGVVAAGDWLSVDITRGIMKTGEKEISFTPPSENVLKTLQYGGLIPRIRAELNIDCER